MPIDQSNCITLQCNFFFKNNAGLQEKIAQCNNVLELHKKILKNLERDSDVLDEFGTKYDQDTEPMVSVIEAVCVHSQQLVHHTVVDEDAERNRGVY